MNLKGGSAADHTRQEVCITHPHRMQLTLTKFCSDVFDAVIFDTIFPIASVIGELDLSLAIF